MANPFGKKRIFRGPVVQPAPRHRPVSRTAPPAARSRPPARGRAVPQPPPVDPPQYPDDIRHLVLQNKIRIPVELLSGLQPLLPCATFIELVDPDRAAGPAVAVRSFKQLTILSHEPPDKFKAAMSNLQHSAFFWFDKPSCSVLDELSQICQSGRNHAILIAHANLFIDAVLVALPPTYITFIYKDVIVAVPALPRVVAWFKTFRQGPIGSSLVQV